MNSEKFTLKSQPEIFESAELIKKIHECECRGFGPTKEGREAFKGKVDMSSLQTLTDALSQLGDNNFNRKELVAELIAEIGEPAVEKLTEMISNEDLQDNQKTWISTALGKIGEPALEKLGLLIKNKTASKYAIQALGQSSSLKAIETLINALEEDGNINVENALESLNERLDIKTQMPFLIKALSSENRKVKEVVMQVLDECNDPDVFQPLAKIIEGGDDKLKEEAAEAIKVIAKNIKHSYFEDNEYDRNITVSDILEKEEKISPVENLIELAKRGNDVDLRLSAINSLSVFEDKKVVDFLLESMKDDDVRIRDISVFALGEIKSYDSMESLLEMAEQANSGITRYKFINALEGIQNEKVARYFVDCLRDEEVQEYVAEMIKNLGTIATGPLTESLKDDKISEISGEILEEITDRWGSEELIEYLKKKK